jgi:hypothetical protein
VPDGPITHPGTVGFLHRHYGADEAGRWFVQNGPQRAYVAIDLAPWVLSLDGIGRLCTPAGRVVEQVDALVLTEVYAAGEAPIVAADGRALARAVRVGGKVEPVVSETVAELPAAIASIVKPGDVVLTMGAGSIGGVPARLRALGQGAE